MVGLRDSKQRKILNLMIPVLAFLIVLFLFLGKKMEQQNTLQAPPDAPPLVNNAAPNVIDFGHLRLHREQQKWHVEPAKALPADLVQQLGTDWQTALNSDYQMRPLTNASGALVSLTFSGVDAPLVVKVIQTRHGLWQLYFVSQRKLIELKNSRMLQLLPPAGK